MANQKQISYIIHLQKKVKKLSEETTQKPCLIK